MPSGRPPGGPACRRWRRCGSSPDDRRRGATRAPAPAWSGRRRGRRAGTRPGRPTTASCASWVTITPATPRLQAERTQPHHAFAVHGVERAGRLVGQQQPAVADDRPGDGHPLALAAGQLVGVAIGRDRRGRARSSAARAAPRRRLAPTAVELQRERDVLDRGQPGQQVEVLEHVADRPAAQPGPVVARHREHVDWPSMLHLTRWSPPRGVPAMVSSVLLPEPLGPMMATSSPASTVRSTSRRAWTARRDPRRRTWRPLPARAPRSSIPALGRSGRSPRPRYRRAPPARAGRRTSVRIRSAGAGRRAMRASAASSQRITASSR